MSSEKKEPNILFYGDNLDILTRIVDGKPYLPDDFVDLIYLDPPFKSGRNYNVLFQEQNGTRSEAQIKAFEDTWQWDQAASAMYLEVVEKGGAVSDAMQAFRKFLGDTDMLAYLSMMAPRLIQLQRVLKETGSIYIHCDPTASHYLKMLMDSILGPANFRGEIIWKCTSAHSNARRLGNVHQTLLFYSKTEKYKWNPTYVPYEQEYVDTYYRYKDDDGRRFMSSDLVGHKGVNPEYEWRGIKRPWRYPKHRLDELNAAGKIFWTRNNFPRYKRYLDEMPGMPLQSVWVDILPVVSWSREGLGYPTQKPEALLERVITASSSEGDLVLDPFCGCGTTISVAHRLKRRWIGIDITHLAISLIKHRLYDSFGDELSYVVVGEPIDVGGAAALAKEDPYQFQFWALGLANARPTEQKKGADKGIDGRKYFHDEGLKGKTKQIIFSVKAGKTGVAHVRDLRGVIERENAEIGVLISFQEPTRDMRKESASAGFYRSPTWHENYPRIQLITVGELLEGKKLNYPSTKDVDTTFKKAPKAKRMKKAKNRELFEGKD